jgi:hypothetical protein
VQKKIQEKGEHKPILDALINSNLRTIQGTLIIYQTHLQHPMIAHYAKRGHVYKVCCEPIETPDMFNQYLENFNIESKQEYAMNKFLTNWFDFVVFFFFLSNR